MNNGCRSDCFHEYFICLLRSAADAFPIRPVTPLSRDNIYSWVLYIHARAHVSIYINARIYDGAWLYRCTLIYTYINIYIYVSLLHMVQRNIAHTRVPAVGQTRERIFVKREANFFFHVPFFTSYPTATIMPPAPARKAYLKRFFFIIF